MIDDPFEPTEKEFLEDKLAQAECYIKDLQQDKRGLEDEIVILKLTLVDAREALRFARSVIKSGEGWTDTCEEIFGKVL